MVKAIYASDSQPDRAGHRALRGDQSLRSNEPTEMEK